MADKKISALTGATTPLAGSEVLPIVQSGSTVKVSVDNLTAGKTVNTGDVIAVKTSSAAVTDGLTVQNLASAAGTEAGIFFSPTTATGNIRGARITGINDGSNVIGLKFYTGTGAAITSKFEMTADGNLAVSTAGKGITTGGATALGFGVNNSTTDMTLDTSGNLLVGNTTQILYVNKELNVNAASGSSGFVFATGNAANLYMTAGSTNGNITTKGTIPLLLGTNETERLRVDGSTGNVGIGGPPAATAILDVQSTTKGVRFPNMTTTQKNAITPSAGTVIFDTTLSKLCVYSGAAWQTITSV